MGIEALKSEELNDHNRKEVSIIYLWVKRFLDLICSFLALVILSPVFLILIIAIKLDSKGPAFFKQKRVGIHKTHFNILKFRTMKTNTPKDIPTHQLMNPEQYITRVGKLLRKTSLDELPQIWNIFVGQMSVIGPRPALWNQYDLIEERDKYGANDVPVGLTGWAQINGRDKLEITIKAKFDGEYVQKMNFAFDAKCFLRTIASVLKHDGVIDGGTGKMDRSDTNLLQHYCVKENDKDLISRNKYSVLMSVYKNDDPKFLEIALKSIYDDQTRKPDEIVIVFDGPLSEGLYTVLDIFKEGKDEIVHYYPQDVNRGLGQALRIGSEQCTGNYIFRMDSDDISDSKRFEKQIYFVEEHPEIAVVGTNIAEFQESISETNLRVRICPEKHEDILKMCKRRNPINHVSACIKKSELIKCGGYESLLLLEDYYLWIRMIGFGSKFANINEPLVYVRVGNGFDTKRGAKERITGWKTLQKYMLKYGIINRVDAIVNMFYINAFVRMPKRLKKYAYEKVLRKN